MARKPSGRGRAPKKSSNPLPLVIGGVVVLAVVIGFIAMGGGDDDAKSSPDAGSAAEEDDSAAGSSAAPVQKPTGKLYDGKTKSEWTALKKKVDMTAWDKADRLMADARKSLAEAERLRSGGDEAGFKRAIQEALDVYGKADGAIQDFIYMVEAVDQDLWVTDAGMFKSEDAAITRFRKQFRGYLQFRK